jgi:hypothetical protein
MAQWTGAILCVAQPDVMLTKLCRGMDVAVTSERLVEEVGVRRRIYINEATDPAPSNSYVRRNWSLHCRPIHRYPSDGQLPRGLDRVIAT